MQVLEAKTFLKVPCILGGQALPAGLKCTIILRQSDKVSEKVQTKWWWVVRDFGINAT